MAGTIILRDESWSCKLSTEDRPTNVKDKHVLLEVDTGKWYVYYKGAWYEQ